MAPGRIRFFKSALEFRAWLEANHSSKTELHLGFYRKDSGKKGITYAEALDEALCYGWIDGVKHRVDELSYSLRFSPRKAISNWSRINLAHFARLKKAGRVAPAGLKAYESRKPERTGVYSFENAPRALCNAHEREFKMDTVAWKFFQEQPPGYRRLAVWWIVSAKRPETQERRLAQLIQISRKGQRIGPANASATKRKNR